MNSIIPPTERQKMVAMYQGRWQHYGYSPQALGWTKGKQDIRFEVLLSAFDCEGRSFVDVGCGFGELNQAVRQRCTRYTYHGVDLTAEFVEQGRLLYDGDGVTFQTGDFLELEFDRSFDCGIASGLFNYRFEAIDNYEYIEQVLAKLFGLCREGVAVDFLTDRVNFQREHCYHSNPEKILSIALRLTRNVRLRHDYMPFEFAVILFKDDSFDEHDTVFNRYKVARRDH